MPIRSRPTAGRRGYGARWNRYRLTYLRAHPLCVKCKAAGRTEPASVVDHIKDADTHPELFWEPTNHQALCDTCHSGDKQRTEKGGRDQYRGANADGSPMDPSHHWNAA